MKKLSLLVALLPLVFATSLPAGKKEPGPKPVVPNGRFVGDGAVKVVKQEVQPLIDKHQPAAQVKALEALLKAENIPAHGKTPVRKKAFAEPWKALEDLEFHGLMLAEFAKKGPEGLGMVLDLCQNFLERPHGQTDRVPPKNLKTLDDHVAYIVKVFDQAKKLHEEAFAKIPLEERKKLFADAESFVRNFGPQLDVNERTLPVLKSDRDFFLAMEKVHWGKLVASAQVLASLSQPAWLASLEKTLATAVLDKVAVGGVTGNLLFFEKTSHGFILIGGKGPNTYDVKDVALLIDLGGDDVYKGRSAANYDAEHPLSVVIDLAGNDMYQCTDMGLATGRLGVGLLFDLDGNDTYQLAPGSGGVGLGGIGVLCDAKGDDIYTGTRFTQGAAVQGIGLLWDIAGNDKHTSWGFSVGLGGPGGVGCVLDNAGNDSYQCGRKYPSGYNQSDAPNAKPGDPNFQWDCFGLAMGLGRRIFPPTAELMQYNLAGGVGMVIDLAGDDRYDSSNFSQACGYFYGTGLILDLAGNDHYQAARYGMSSGAHYGLGLFADYQGKDTYTSVGPTYNCAAAWDRSAFLFIDAGVEDDVYVLDRSSGLGRADIGSWAVFADLGGNDRYVAPSAMASTSKDSLAIFFDRAGKDDYVRVGLIGKHQPANAELRATPDGGLFVDR